MAKSDLAPVASKQRPRAAASGRPPASFAVLEIALAIVAISCTPIFFRISELGPSATSFYRGALAVPIFLAWTALERRRNGAARLRLALSWRREGVEVLLASALYSANLVAYAWGLRFTSIANASIISNLAPIFVSLLSFLLFGDRPSRGFLVSMLAAVAGVAVLSAGRAGPDGTSLLGDFLALLAAITFGAYLIIVARLRQRLATPVLMLWIASLSATGPVVAAGIAGESLLARSFAGWASLVGLAVISYAIGQGLLTAALAHVSAAFSSVALLALPVGSALLGWALLGERISLAQAVGGAIVLAGIFFARRTSG